VGHYRHSKRRSKLTFAHLSNSLCGMPTTSQDTANVSKMGPTIAEGPADLGVRRQNPSVGSAPPRANKARDKATQGMASS
jgi:hypothetical protein